MVLKKVDLGGCGHFAQGSFLVRLVPPPLLATGSSTQQLKEGEEEEEGEGEGRLAPYHTCCLSVCMPRGEEGKKGGGKGGG